MSNYYKHLTWLAAIGGLALVAIVALIVVFGGDFSASGNKNGGSINIRGRQPLQEQTRPEQTKVSCLPGEENSQPLDCNNQ